MWRADVDLTLGRGEVLAEVVKLPVATLSDCSHRIAAVMSPPRIDRILDIRMLPDEDVDELYKKLADVIDDPQVTVVPEPIYRPESMPSPIDNEMFQTIEAVSERLYPGSTTLPVMATGATDMAQVRAKGTQSATSSRATLAK